MKKVTLLLSLVFLYCNAQAQKWTSEYTLGYYWVNPLDAMGEIIHDAQGVNAEFFMLTPDKRFAAGLEMCFANYGITDYPVVLSSDEQVIHQDAWISNQIVNTFLTARYYLKTEGPFLPYLNLKAGASGFVSYLHMEKEEGEGHCSSAEMEELHCSATFAMATGGGVKADLSYLFKKLPEQALMLDFGVNYVRGGNVSYLSPEAYVNPDETVSTPFDQYVKTDMGTVRVRDIGNIYHSTARMLDFRIGISVRPSGWKNR